MSTRNNAERVTAVNADAWRAWLAKNHASSAGVWLLRARPGNDDVYVSYEDSVRQALCFGWVDGQAFSFDDRLGGLWFSPRRPQSGWAATNKARLAILEQQGLLAPAGIRAIELAKQNGTWTMLDGPEAGIEPPELTEALNATPHARENWDAFPHSVKKLGLSQIAMAKRPETRATRIAKLVADAAEGVRP